MKLKNLRPNKRRYKRSNCAPNEFFIIRFIGTEWIVAENETGKEVVFSKDGADDDDWSHFDEEILYPDELPKKGLL